jgi:hypothetical protein
MGNPCPLSELVDLDVALDGSSGWQQPRERRERSAARIKLACFAVVRNVY